MSFLAAFLSLLLAGVGAPDAQKIEQASVEADLSLVNSYAVAMGHFVEAGSVLNGVGEKSDMAGLVSLMAANRRAVKAVELGIGALPRPAEYPTGTVERSATEGLAISAISLKTNLDKQFDQIQRFLSASDQKELIKVVAETTETAADLEQAWAGLVESTVLLTYAFVDMTRLTDGKLQHLRVTASQRRDLVATLDQWVPGVPSSLRAGMHKSLAAPTTLKSFLLGPHRSADEKSRNQ